MSRRGIQLSNAGEIWLHCVGVGSARSFFASHLSVYFYHPLACSMLARSRYNDSLETVLGNFAIPKIND